MSSHNAHDQSRAEESRAVHAHVQVLAGERMQDGGRLHLCPRDLAELRPSPKPCFEFSKTGSCVRGQACMFVHSVENMIQATGVPTAEHHHTARQRLIAGANIGPMSLATRCTKTQLHLLSPSLLLQPSTGSMQSLRPPRGLEDIGMMAGVRERGRP